MVEIFKTINQKFAKTNVEVYKTINHLKPPFMLDLFTKKVVEYDFGIKILCELPPARSQRFGTNSLKLRGATPYAPNSLNYPTEVFLDFLFWMGAISR